MSAPEHTVDDPRFTLGVVIGVPEPQLAELRAWRREFGGPTTEPIAPHITLISGVHTAGWGPAAAHVQRVAAQTAGFEVQLGPGAASFRPASQVVYLPLSGGAEQCRALHRRLVGDYLQHTSAFAYHPHLTIAQNVPDERLDAALQALRGVRMSFAVEHIDLFDTGVGHWSLVQRLPLGH
ncbi:2'-5' RNA ligase family protein [Glutamicibacter endophyticus]